MDSSNALLIADEPEQVGPAALLRGTSRGLEMVVNARATTAMIAAALKRRLDEAPGFFRDSDVRVGVDDGPLAPGCLAQLDSLATDFGLRIIEVVAREAVPKPSLAAGSAPNGFDEDVPTRNAVAVMRERVERATTEPAMLADTDLMISVEGESFDDPTQTAVPIQLAATPETELETASNETRLVVGPVRSGVILEHAGHLVVFGDVNPGAEVRATGNIMILGRLRGTAHAGIGQDVGFILALRLEPQQLRIGRMVARAADSDAPDAGAEIAYGNGDAIVVERYQGKLPRNLATSI